MIKLKTTRCMLMNRHLFYTIINSNLPKDYSMKNQKEILNLAFLILDINQRVIKEGIGIFEDYCSHYQLLDKGLQLIRMGFDPELTESLLFNTVVINGIDLLTSLVTIEGVHGIQTAQPPYITKELLKSYFALNFDAEFEAEYAKRDQKADNFEPISAKKVTALIESQT